MAVAFIGAENESAYFLCLNCTAKVFSITSAQGGHVILSCVYTSKPQVDPVCSNLHALMRISQLWELSDPHGTHDQY